MEAEIEKLKAEHAAALEAAAREREELVSRLSADARGAEEELQKQAALQLEAEKEKRVAHLRQRFPFVVCVVCVICVVCVGDRRTDASGRAVLPRERGERSLQSLQSQSQPVVLRVRHLGRGVEVVELVVPDDLGGDSGELRLGAGGVQRARPSRGVLAPGRRRRRGR